MTFRSTIGVAYSYSCLHPAFAPAIASSRMLQRLPHDELVSFFPVLGGIYIDLETPCETSRRPYLSALPVEAIVESLEEWRIFPPQNVFYPCVVVLLSLQHIRVCIQIDMASNLPSTKRRMSPALIRASLDMPLSPSGSFPSPLTNLTHISVLGDRSVLPNALICVVVAVKPEYGKSSADQEPGTKNHQEYDGCWTDRKAHVSSLLKSHCRSLWIVHPVIDRGASRCGVPKT